MNPDSSLDVQKGSATVSFDEPTFRSRNFILDRNGVVTCEDLMVSFDCGLTWQEPSPAVRNRYINKLVEAFNGTLFDSGEQPA